DAGAALKAKGVAEVMLPANKIDEPTTINTISMFWGLGGQLVDESGAPVFFQGDNATYLAQVFQFCRDLVTRSAMPATVVGMDEAAIRPFFYSGEALAIGQSSSSIRQIWTDFPPAKGDLAVADYPMPPGKTAIPVLGGFSYIVTTADPARRAAAWKFVSFMTSAENMGAIDEALGQLPVRASVWKDNRFFATDPLMQSYKALYDGPLKVRPPVPIYPAISAAISTEVAEVVAGHETPEQAVAKARDAVMAEYNRQNGH
ncbi:MAG: extracellular solute-binding protein, partial [Acetobacteraceae bacterium]|nr:extracellular solute-binding protein [Acetobacteraceae bacterium]